MPEPTQTDPTRAEAPAPVSGVSYAAGVVHYRSYPELERCLVSLASQRRRPVRTVVVDADGDPAVHAALRGRYPDVVWLATPNLGYAGGANRILDEIQRHAPQSAFALILNPDVELEPEFSEQLVDAAVADDRVALASGKLLRPEGNVIDSAGIAMPRNRRPRDRGSDERDVGQYDRREYVFGASGAALLVRIAALAQLAIDGEVFDEDFFVYHEDTDLAWRASLLGWRVLYEPAARGIHGRSWRRDGRFDKPVPVRRHSFKNHYLEMIKNERGARFWRDLPTIALWEILRLGFALLRDPAILPAYLDAARLAPAAWRKRRILQARERAVHRRPAV